VSDIIVSVSAYQGANKTFSFWNTTNSTDSYTALEQVTLTAGADRVEDDGTLIETDIAADERVGLTVSGVLTASGCITIIGEKL